MILEKKLPTLSRQGQFILKIGDIIRVSVFRSSVFSVPVGFKVAGRSELESFAASAGTFLGGVDSAMTGSAMGFVVRVVFLLP